MMYDVNFTTLDSHSSYSNLFEYYCLLNKSLILNYYVHMFMLSCVIQRRQFGFGSSLL
jgi:hypothetical protein